MGDSQKIVQKLYDLNNSEMYQLFEPYLDKRDKYSNGYNEKLQLLCALTLEEIDNIIESANIHLWDIITFPNKDGKPMEMVVIKIGKFIDAIDKDGICHSYSFPNTNIKKTNKRINFEKAMRTALLYEIGESDIEN